MSFKRTNISSVDRFMAPRKKEFCFCSAFGMVKRVYYIFFFTKRLCSLFPNIAKLLIQFKAILLTI
jgi:hypothetical protein